MASIPAGTSSAGTGRSPRQGDGIQGLSGWRVQWRVVDALTYRELRTRVGETRGGFLGILLQPIGNLLIWTAFLSLRSHDRSGNLNIVLFLTSGIILFRIFSQTATRSIKAISANEALLFYRPVKPIDTVIARTICETGLSLCCWLLILVGTWIYLDQVVMADVSLFVLSILMTTLLGFSTGVIFMTAGHLVPGFENVAGWLPRILWFLSGIPFRYWYFPAWTHPFFRANPLMHCIELNRRSLSADYFTPYVDIPYALTWVLVMSALAFWIYKNNERRLLTL